MTPTPNSCPARIIDPVLTREEERQDLTNQDNSTGIDKYHENTSEAEPFLQDRSDSSSEFASREILKKFIPELEPDDERAQTLRVKMAKRANMLKVQMGLAGFVAIVVITFKYGPLKAPRPTSVVSVLSLLELARQLRPSTVLFMWVLIFYHLFY